jgi:hypothetical protein
MESLEHAMKRDAPIVAEYLGGAVNCDAYHMTDPRSDGLGVSSCIKQSLEDAGVAPEEVIQFLYTLLDLLFIYPVMHKPLCFMRLVICDPSIIAVSFGLLLNFDCYLFSEINSYKTLIFICPFMDKLLFVMQSEHCYVTK